MKIFTLAIGDNIYKTKCLSLKTQVILYGKTFLIHKKKKKKKKKGKGSQKKRPEGEKNFKNRFLSKTLIFREMDLDKNFWVWFLFGESWKKKILCFYFCTNFSSLTYFGFFLFLQYILVQLITLSSTLHLMYNVTFFFNS